MKRLLLMLIINMFAFQMFASELVLIPTKNYDETKSVFRNPSITVNFYRNEFVIATLDGLLKEPAVKLADNPWEGNLSYYLVYLENVNRTEYLNRVGHQTEILYDGGQFLVLRTDENVHGHLSPAKNDGIVKISNVAVSLPSPQHNLSNVRFDPDPFIVNLISQVNSANITASVQHLQDYGTRNCYQPQSIQAQNWIKEYFESYGYSVEVMDFYMSGGNASDNIIATKTGTKYPEEYVVLGGHYDSYVFSGSSAPGADDNASGVAGVMEAARLMANHDFDRTIIFCAFSGEEYGLYGSEAYADRCAQQNMNILGYFNMDMIGYLQAGSPVHTDVIYPSSALPLAQFYEQVCSVYLPDFIVEAGALIGGDSDHTSFNNAGYMGIFPFEDGSNYSPYIHSANDLVGPSYNNAEQAGIFTQAIIASVVTMANMLTPPQNLVGIPGDGEVDLMWDVMYDIDYYKVYKNGTFLASTTSNAYHDEAVTNGTQYEYYVTAIYSDTGEESDPSNEVLVTPMPPIALPLTIDFENGAPYWNFDGTWGVSASSSHSPTHSISESPTGQYQNSIEIYATLNSVNLQGFTSASLSFWTKYDLESGYDYMWLEISTNGSNWTEIAEYNGTQSTWTQKTYPLTAYLGNPYVVIRFHFYSDSYIQKDGMYIDDFTITASGLVFNPPLNFMGQASGTDAVLDWDAPSSGSPDGYNVYRNGALIAEEIATTNYTDAGLTPGTYSYQVSAVYAQGMSAMAGPVEVVISGGSTSGAWETFEDYIAGQKLAQQANAMGRNYWTTWSNAPGGAEDPAVSNTVAHDGANSVVIEGTNDCVLLLGDLTTGKHTLNFWVNIPSGFYGYFNVLQVFAGASSTWGMQAYFDAGGIGTVDAGGAGAGSFSYSYDTWTFVELVVDLDMDWAEFYVAGADVVQWQWSLGTFGTPGPVQLAAANFYAWNANGTPKAYFDDIDFKEFSSDLIFEPFEDYTAGQPLAQQAIALGRDYWTTWSNAPGGAEDLTVSAEHAHEGVNSALCSGTNDGVLLLGDKTSGKYSLNFYLYIPTGKVGYYNILQVFNGSNSTWGMEVYLNPGGIAELNAGGVSGIATFNYNYDEWVYIENIIDLNSDEAALKVNGTEVSSWQWSPGASGGGVNALGAMDIYAATTNGTPYFFIDDIQYVEFLSLPAPTNLVAAVNDNDITLTWDAPPSDEFIGYNVYRDNEIIAQEITALTFVDYNLLPGTYQYDVKAVYDEGYSSGAGPVPATIAGGVWRDKVLVEIGTGTWCQYCPGAAMGADELVENGWDVAVIEYHSGDTYETTESAGRVAYYDITGFPTAFFDGVISHVGGSNTVSMYPTYVPSVETRLAKVSLFEMNIAAEYTGGNNFDISVTANNVYPYPGNNLVLQLVCTESEIMENWQGQNHLSFVCRDMLPDQNGTAVNFSGQPNQTFDFQLNTSTWNMEHCEVVAFIQDNTTKEVLQAAKFDLGTIVGIGENNNLPEISIYPNPAKDFIQISSDKRISQIRIMSQTGQLMFDRKMNGTEINMNISAFGSGVYFVEIISETGKLTQKLVVE